jgi:methyltransferase-like protein 6
MSESPVEKPSRNDGARKEMDSENLEKHIARAQDVIASDKKEVPPFWINKYKKEAARNWDLFYKRNTTKFFKGKNPLPIHTRKSVS